MILTTWAFHELRRDTRGQVLVWGAVIVPALALFLGLSLDVGLLYDVRRRAQSAADGAAASGAMELARQTTSYVTSAALYDAGRNGFDNDETEVTVTVSNPPVSGPRLGDSNFVEVVVREDVDTYFTGISVLAIPRWSGYSDPRLGCKVFVFLSRSMLRSLPFGSLNAARSPRSSSLEGFSPTRLRVVPSSATQRLFSVAAVARYPPGTGSAQIRPSISANSLRLRCPSANSSQ